MMNLLNKVARRKNEKINVDVDVDVDVGINFYL